MNPHKFSFLLLFVCQVLQVRMVSTCESYPSILICRLSNGKFLPTQLSPTIRSLIISDSHLDSLTPLDFSLLINLESLLIDTCNIPLTEGINLLVYLKHLSSLHILNSKITVKVMNLFSSGVNIRILALPQNKLTHIPKGFFRYLPKLESIDLSCNEIESVEIDAFKDLTHLVDINLSHNRIGLRFDPSFFFDSTCVYCASFPDETRCPDRAVEKCRGIEQVDGLWRRFAGRNISLAGNPLCETFTVETGEEGQHLGFTTAPRLDPLDGDAYHNKMAARQDPQDGDANQNNMTAHQVPQDGDGTQHQSSTPTLPTESQDGDCSFYSVGRCHKQLKKRYLFLSRVCHKKNKYRAAGGAADRVVHPPEQEIPDDSDDNISARDHGGNDTSVIDSNGESNSRDVAEDHPTQEDDRRFQGDEVESQCQGDEPGRVECQGNSPGEDREPVENSGHDETQEEQELQTPFWQRSVTYLQFCIALIIIFCVVIIIGIGLYCCSCEQSTSTSGKDATNPSEIVQLMNESGGGGDVQQLSSQQTLVSTASTEYYSVNSK